MNLVNTMYYGTRTTQKRERRDMILQIAAGLFASGAFVCLWIVIAV